MPQISKTKAIELSQPSLFLSQYEDDFFLRTLGDLVRIPEVALSELVANAWDAGATEVEITIPTEMDGTLSVQDNGCGLTTDQFFQRWMTLAYDRQKRQGSDVEFPSDILNTKRKAYGRNGQGRHGLLCFGNFYNVESWRDGSSNEFSVLVSSGKEPLKSSLLTKKSKNGHGTKVSVEVTKHLTNADKIRTILSEKFVHDPNFTIKVNGRSIPTIDLPSLTENKKFQVTDPEESTRIVSMELLVFKSDAGRTKHQSGIAFWVGGRLVGEPGWVLGDQVIIDGRTKAGRGLTLIIKSNDLLDQILPDWTGFKKTPLIGEVNKVVSEIANEVLQKVLSSQIKETTSEVLSTNNEIFKKLKPSDRVEVKEVITKIVAGNPLLSSETITLALKSIVDVKQKIDPANLIQKIMALPEEDMVGLNRLLDEWSIRDALTVLDEIGRRIKVVEGIEKLMGDSKVDELQVIHPMMTQARWLFGPEFESALFSSNITLQNAVRKIFKKKLAPNAFENSRKRPDLIILQDATLCAVATEEITEGSLVTFQKILLIELKKGGSTIGRDEMGQAQGYVEDLLNCGLDGKPYINAFVVGNEVDPKTTTVRKMGENPDTGRVEAASFSQLVRTANIRLFRIRDRVHERYPESGEELAEKIMAEPQMELKLK